MLLLDTSFLIEFEDELARGRPGAATGVLAARRSQATAISVVAMGELAEGYLDAAAFHRFISHFRVVPLSQAIAWRTGQLQSQLPQRLGENDAWIAATALAYGATLVGRERAFGRVPRLDYLAF